jgi:hypothetical protein
MRSAALCTDEARDLCSAVPEHALHAAARDAERVGDRPRPVTFLTQAKNGRPCRLI